MHPCVGCDRDAKRQRDLPMSHGCQMDIAGFLDHMCLALRASCLWLCYAALQNWIPSFPWIAPPHTPPWRNPRKGRDQILPSGNFVMSFLSSFHLTYRRRRRRRRPSFSEDLAVSLLLLLLLPSPLRGINDAAPPSKSGDPERARESSRPTAATETETTESKAAD